METAAAAHAEVVWDYMTMGHQLDRADLILVCGSNDIRSSSRPQSVCSGRFADLFGTGAPRRVRAQIMHCCCIK